MSSKEHSVPPPRQPERHHRLALTSLWQALPEENRLQILRTLRRVLVQQLPAAPPVEEVTNEYD